MKLITMLLALGIFSCVIRRTNSDSLSDNAPPPSAEFSRHEDTASARSAICPAERFPASFSVEPVEGDMPAIDPLGLLDVQNIVQPGEPNSYRIRIDLCLDDDLVPSLNQIVYQRLAFDFRGGTRFSRIIPGRDSEARLDDAVLFGGEGELDFRIPFYPEFDPPPNPNASFFGFRMLRYRDSNFVVMGVFERGSDGAWTATYRDGKTVTIGTFRFGDPFVAIDPDLCPQGQRRTTWRYGFQRDHGRVKIQISVCELDTPATLFLFPTRVLVWDEGAPEPHNSRVYALGVDDIFDGFPPDVEVPQRFFMLATVHHNFCNSLRLRLPHADYGFSEMTSARPSALPPGVPFQCPALVPGAPVPREHISDMPNPPEVLMVRYGSGEATTIEDPATFEWDDDLSDGLEDQ